MEGLAAVASISPARSLALSASPAELAWIAALCDARRRPRHLEQLQAVLQQGGTFNDAQEWYPFEVIERGASQLQLGHEREFVICVLLWLQALAQGRASILDPSLHLDDRAMDIEALPDDARRGAGCVHRSGVLRRPGDRVESTVGRLSRAARDSGDLNVERSTNSRRYPADAQPAVRCRVTTLPGCTTAVRATPARPPAASCASAPSTSIPCRPYHAGS